MAKEIETKLRVESFDKLRKTLAELTGSSPIEQKQCDDYYDNPEHRLRKTDKCLRIRRQWIDGALEAFLTYKGPREQSCFKSRTEVNIILDDPDAVDKMLVGLGFEKAISFEKLRQVWKVEDCEVALDELPAVGFFVEIEGPDADAIKKVQAKLALRELEHVSESYADLISQELRLQSKDASACVRLNGKER